VRGVLGVKVRGVERVLMGPRAGDEVGFGLVKKGVLVLGTLGRSYR
jgi:hypothetical protein